MPHAPPLAPPTEAPDDDALAALDAVDLLLLRALREGLPLSVTPYADLGAACALSEPEVLARLGAMRASGVLGPIVPLLERGASRPLLAALAVPDERFEAVAAQVNALPEVLQSVRREHRYNLWFLCRDEAAGAACCARIEGLTGLAVLRLPEADDYAPAWRLAS